MEKITNQHAADPQEDVMQKPNAHNVDELLENLPADADAFEDVPASDGDADQEPVPSTSENEGSEPSSSPDEDPSDEKESDEKATTQSDTKEALPEGEAGELPVQGEDEEHLNIPEVLPILPLKDTVIYPFSVQPFSVGQERYIRLIDDVMRGNRLVVLVAQKSPDIDHAGSDDIYRVGTVSRVGRMFRMPDGTVQIAVQGLERVTIDEFTQEKPYLQARVTAKTDIQEDDTETEAIKRNVITYFQRLVALVQNVPEGVAAALIK